jgi:hypothetical protein
VQFTPDGICAQQKPCLGAALALATRAVNTAKANANFEITSGALLRLSLSEFIFFFLYLLSFSAKLALFFVKDYFFKTVPKVFAKNDPLFGWRRRIFYEPSQ